MMYREKLMPEGCASPLDENPGRPTTSNTASGAPITLYGIIKISFVLASLRSLQGVSHASYSRPLEKTAQQHAFRAELLLS